MQCTQTRAGLFLTYNMYNVVRRVAMSSYYSTGNFVSLGFFCKVADHYWSLQDVFSFFGGFVPLVQMILWAHVSCPTKQKLPSLSCCRIRLQPCSLRPFPFPILDTNTGDISKLNSTIISSFFFFFGSYLTMPGRKWVKYRKKYNKDWECWTVGY